MSDMCERWDACTDMMRMLSVDEIKVTNSKQCSLQDVDDFNHFYIMYTGRQDILYRVVKHCTGHFTGIYTIIITT